MLYFECHFWTAEPCRDKAIKTNDKSDDPKGEPLFNLTPWGNFRVASFLILLVAFLIVSLCAGVIIGIGTMSSNAFWKFAKNAAPEDIQKIEIQRVENQGKIVTQSIMIDDKKSIEDFLSAFSTIEEYDPDRLVEYNLRVILHLKSIETIEMDCYTVEGSNDIIIASVFIKPNFFAASSVTAIFPGPYFHDWVVDAGIELK